MTLQKVSTDCDLGESAVEWAVRQFVDAFSRWPTALIATDVAGPSAKDALERAKTLGLAIHLLPPQISLAVDAWAICDNKGNAIWSPGA